MQLLSETDRLIDGHRFHIRHIRPEGEQDRWLVAHYSPTGKVPVSNHMLKSKFELEAFLIQHMAVIAACGACDGLIAVRLAAGGKSHYSHLGATRTNCGITFKTTNAMRVGDSGARPPLCSCERCKIVRY